MPLYLQLTLPAGYELAGSVGYGLVVRLLVLLMVVVPAAWGFWRRRRQASARRNKRDRRA